VSGISRIQACRLWLLPVVLVTAPGQQPTTRDGEPIVTTLCEVVAHPERFANKTVSFKAWFESDGMDHSILNSPGCKQGIVPYPAKDDKKRPDVEAFEQAIGRGAPGTADETVVGIFTGRFVWTPPSKRILEIEGVSELRVSPLKRSLRKRRE
jgi:hypothetical protein